MFEHLEREFPKLAVIKQENVREGTPIVGSLEKLKKVMRPGDIILTKPLDKGKHWTRKVEAWWVGSPWSHTGMVDTNGKIIHFYKGIKGKTNLTGEFKIRSHQADTVAGFGRDFLLLRPKDSSRKEGLQALQNMKNMPKNVPYSMKNFLRAAFWRKKAPTHIEKNVKKEEICTAFPALAYKNRKLVPGTSKHTLRPAEFARSPNLKHVAAFSPEQVGGYTKKDGTMVKSHSRRS